MPYIGDLLSESLKSPTGWPPLLTPFQSCDYQDSHGFTVKRYVVPNEDIETILPQVEQSISAGWYAHFVNKPAGRVYVVFTGKIFPLTLPRNASWEEMMAYGESVGVGREWTTDMPLDMKPVRD
jgi:hypothetical protein